MLIERRQLQQWRHRRRVELAVAVTVYVLRRQLLHRQQVRDRAGRAAHGESRSPPFPLEAAAAAAAHRRLVVERQHVAVIADLAGHYRAVRRYHVALEAYRALSRLYTRQLTRCKLVNIEIIVVEMYYSN